MDISRINNSNISKSSVYNVSVMPERINFGHKDKITPKENKKHSLKEISDIVIISVSALMIALPLLASMKRGKKDIALKKTKEIVKSAENLEQDIEDIAHSNKQAPFIQKFGCFWDKMSQNHKEFTNNFIYGIGVIVVEPFIILFSPFGNKKASKEDKMSAVARLPITLASTLSFQYSIDKFISGLIPTLSKEGLLGEKFKSFNETFEDLPIANRTKLKAIKELTVFTFSLLTLPLGVALTNSIYGKFLKHLENSKEKGIVKENPNSDVNIKSKNLHRRPYEISFSGKSPIELAKEINKTAGELKNIAEKDFEPSKGFTKKIYKLLSKPINSILYSNWFDNKTSKLGKEGIGSIAFQKLLMWGIILKDTTRATANAALTYYNDDISYENRLYLTLYHIGIAVPNLLIDAIAGFGAIKYQDKFLENMLKKFNLSSKTHLRTKNGLKFFIPVALATIVGKRIIAPAFAVPISGICKKKILDEQKQENQASNFVLSDKNSSKIFKQVNSK